MLDDPRPPPPPQQHPPGQPPQQREREQRERELRERELRERELRERELRERELREWEQRRREQRERELREREQRGREQRERELREREQRGREQRERQQQEQQRQQRIPPPPPTPRQLPLQPLRSVEVRRDTASGAAAVGAELQRQRQVLQHAEQREKQQVDKQQAEQESAERKSRQQWFIEPSLERQAESQRKDAVELADNKEESTGEQTQEQKEERRPERPVVTVPIPVEILPRQPPPQLRPASPSPRESAVPTAAAVAVGVASPPRAISSGVLVAEGTQQSFVPSAAAAVTRADAVEVTSDGMAASHWREGSTSSRRPIDSSLGSILTSASVQASPSVIPVVPPATRQLTTGRAMDPCSASTNQEVGSEVSTRSAATLRAAAAAARDFEEALSSARQEAACSAGLASRADRSQISRGGGRGNGGSSSGSSGSSTDGGGTPDLSRARSENDDVRDTSGQGGRRAQQTSSDSEVEASSADEWVNGDGAAGAGDLSLVSIVAGDIVRAQREAVIREREAAARSRDLRRTQDVETLLAASEDVVADAVRAAARTVASEEVLPAPAPDKYNNGDVNGNEKETGMGHGNGGRYGIFGNGNGNGDGHENGSRNHPDLWDSLLQSGPTVSPGLRRRLHSSSGTRMGVTAATAAIIPPGAVSLESETAERAEREGESDGRLDLGSRGERDVGGRSLHGKSFERRRGRQRYRDGRSERRYGLGDSSDGSGSGSGSDSDRGVGGSGGGDDGEGAGEGRSKRLTPADLQAQLLNELRLHDDLQEAELRADGLMAAQRVEEARQDARAAGLRRERVSLAS